jgi:superoxide dismutase
MVSYHVLISVGIALIQCTPVIGLDLWEHAYFTQFEGNKEAYVDKFWHFINWEKVSANFEKHNLNGFKVAPIVD